MPRNKPRSSLETTIDDNLKRVYQATLEEEVPERFRDLLAQLREQDNAGAAKTENSEDSGTGPERGRS